MGFILIPERGDRVYINAWNWRPTLEILRTDGIVEDEDLLERMGSQFLGAYVDENLAQRIAAALDRRLARMHPGERVRADMSVTAAPWETVYTAGMPVSEIDGNELYSARYEWLMQFRDFCQRSGGFRVS